MQVNSSSTLTILHDGQFWIALCEHEEAGRYGARRIVFGPHEPTDELVFAFVCSQWDRLDFRMGVQSADGETGMRADRINPKRLQRIVRRTVGARGVGTKAQQAIREGYEAHKDECREQGKDARRAEEQRRFELKQQKRKEKRRRR